MHALRLSRPTQVQATAIPAALEGNHVVLTAQTGSGKTLGYVLPLLELLRRDRAREARTTSPASPSPQALIVVPTRELAAQVCRVWSDFTECTGLTCSLLTRQAFQTSNEVAAWVSPARDTAGKGEPALWTRLRHLRYLVLDEADSLFAMQQRNQLAPLPLHRLQGGQLWCVAATMTRGSLAQVEALARALTPSRKLFIARDNGLHEPPRIVRIRFELVQHPPQKVTRLLEWLQADARGLLRDGKSTLVFCNSIQTCRFVQHTLREQGVLALACHGGMPTRMRDAAVEQFANGTADVLICSDLMARGIDWPFVGRVLSFDAPATYHHFLHRAGRLRRGGDCITLIRRARREQDLAMMIAKRFPERTHWQVMEQQPSLGRDRLRP